MTSKLGARAAMVAAGIAVAGMTLADSPANAASAPQPADRSVETNGMTFYDDYWTLDECTTVGDWGLDHGKWTVYDCQASPWDWDLYYDN